MANPRKAAKPSHGSIKASKAPNFESREGHIFGMTTRGKYPNHQVFYHVAYKDKKYLRQLHEGGNTQWVMINNKPVETNYPGRSTRTAPSGTLGVYNVKGPPGLPSYLQWKPGTDPEGEYKRLKKAGKL